MCFAAIITYGTLQWFCWRELPACACVGILAGLPQLSREANDPGRINIQEGTKGGRAGASAPRWIAVDDCVRDALIFAEQAAPAGSRNLTAPYESYLSVLREVIRPARDILHTHKIKGFHELRAVFACERYELITQHRSPIKRGSVARWIGALTVRAEAKSAPNLSTIG